MDNNTPTTVLSVEEAIDKHLPIQLNVTATAATLRHHQRHGFKIGYNSRNEEVEELVKALEEANQYIKHISDPFSFIQFGLPLLTKYNKTT